MDFHFKSVVNQYNLPLKLHLYHFFSFLAFHCDSGEIISDSLKCDGKEDCECGCDDHGCGEYFDIYLILFCYANG